MSTDTRVEIVWLTRRNALGEEFDDVRQVVNMNRSVRAPLLHRLYSLTTVLDELVVDDVDLAGRSQDGDQAGNRVHDQARLALAFLKVVGELLQLIDRAFAVLDIECGHIPPHDTSLLVEQGLVPHQEPPIFPIVAQNALLSAEWRATPQTCCARFADSPEILRVDDTIPVILLLHILDAEAGVIHHSLIHILDGSFGVQHVNVCRNGVDDQAQIAFVRLQSRLSPFAVIDVRCECVPVENSPLAIAHRDPAGLKPAVDTIEPTETKL